MGAGPGSRVPGREESRSSSPTNRESQAVLEERLGLRLPTTFKRKARQACLSFPTQKTAPVRDENTRPARPHLHTQGLGEAVALLSQVSKGGAEKLVAPQTWLLNG